MRRAEPPTHHPCRDTPRPNDCALASNLGCEIKTQAISAAPALAAHPTSAPSAGSAQMDQAEPPVPGSSELPVQGEKRTAPEEPNIPSEAKRIRTHHDESPELEIHSSPSSRRIPFPEKACPNPDSNLIRPMLIDQ
ncbi:unnamed protein product [Clonostachys rhizophaga]|uniref:Uncharacterized protein n=1 Tax=Clonostachys rhizophaga TaxID=160324 RepID=A0A9N9YFG7_9HYPO|nr:unnamed protein product [Clonostachys rhizophaga]